MANPYPWRDIKNLDVVRQSSMWIHFASLFVFGTIALATQVFLFAIIVLVIVTQYRQKNNAKFERGLLVTAIGVILLGIWGIFSIPLTALTSITNNPHVLTDYLWQGIPLATIAAGLYSMTLCHYLEMVGRRYLLPHDISMMEQRKINKTRQALATSTTGNNDTIELGVIVNDVLPWRTSRRGLIAGAPIERMQGHGFIAGASNSGKTTTVAQVIDGFISAGWGVQVLDYKGDIKLPKILAQIAQEYGRGFYFFSALSSQLRSPMNFDPLEGINPREVTAVIKTAFDMIDDGEASYYTSRNKDYLGQLMAMHEAGMIHPAPQESWIDFFIRMLNKDTLSNELAPVLGGADRERAAKARQYLDIVLNIKNDDTASLVSKLRGLQNSFGEIMRPAPNKFSLREIIDENAIGYFSLPVSGDTDSAIALGAITLRNFVNLRNERQARINAGENIPPLLVVADEINNIGTKADVAMEIVTQLRDVGVYLLTSVQSFARMKEGKLYGEITQNVTYQIIMQMPAGEVANELSTLFGTRNDVTSMLTSASSSGMVEHRDSEHSQARESLAEAPRIHPNEIADLHPHQAIFHTIKSPTTRRGRTLPNRAWLGKRAPAPRLPLMFRKDDVSSDIPTVLVVPRDYILNCDDLIMDEKIAESLQHLATTNNTAPPKNTTTQQEQPKQPQPQQEQPASVFVDGAWGSQPEEPVTLNTPSPTTEEQPPTFTSMEEALAERERRLREQQSQEDTPWQ